DACVALFGLRTACARPNAGDAGVAPTKSPEPADSTPVSCPPSRPPIPPNSPPAAKSSPQRSRRPIAVLFPRGLDFLLRLLQLLDVPRRKLRSIDLDRQLVQLRRQFEGNLVIGIVHAGQRVGTDVKRFVELEDDRDGVLHFLTGDLLAINAERPGAALADAA